MEAAALLEAIKKEQKAKSPMEDGGWVWKICSSGEEKCSSHHRHRAHI